MELKDYTTEELRAELKRRTAEEKAKKESVLRCRMCKHWREISYWGYPNPANYVKDVNRSCRFFKTKNGKYYRVHNTSDIACEHFERKEDKYLEMLSEKYAEDKAYVRKVKSIADSISCN